jgi:hypothetical protein
MTEQPPTPANSNSEPPKPTVEETTLQVGEARLHLHAQLPPDVRLQVRVQALTSDDQPLEEQSVTLGEGRFTPPLNWRSRPASSSICSKVTHSLIYLFSPFCDYYNIYPALPESLTAHGQKPG